MEELYLSRGAGALLGRTKTGDFPQMALEGPSARGWWSHAFHSPIWNKLTASLIVPGSTAAELTVRATIADTGSGNSRSPGTFAVPLAARDIADMADLAVLLLNLPWRFPDCDYLRQLQNYTSWADYAHRGAKGRLQYLRNPEQQRYMTLGARLLNRPYHDTEAPALSWYRWALLLQVAKAGIGHHMGPHGPPDYGSPRWAADLKVGDSWTQVSAARFQLDFPRNSESFPAAQSMWGMGTDEPSLRKPGQLGETFVNLGLRHFRPGALAESLAPTFADLEAAQEKRWINSDWLPPS